MTEPIFFYTATKRTPMTQSSNLVPFNQYHSARRLAMRPWYKDGLNWFLIFACAVLIIIASAVLYNLNAYLGEVKSSTAPFPREEWTVPCKCE